MKNRAGSIRARLLNLARKENINFQLIIIRFLHERLLFRLSKSDFCEQFILKGGHLYIPFMVLKQGRLSMWIYWGKEFQMIHKL